MEIRNKVGPPVEGNDFYGREKELKAAISHLTNGQSLLLSAPRRIGKSSFAKKLKSLMQEKEWQCVYIDMEHITTEEGFLQEMVASLKKASLFKEQQTGELQHLKDVLKLIDSVSMGNISINLNHKDEKENLYNTISNFIMSDEDSLIVIDELTLFLEVMCKDDEGKDKVSYILNWLRSLRQYSQTKIRWLFCGSVGLKNFASKYGLSSTINDLFDFRLDEMTDDEALQLLLLLGRAEKLPLNEETGKMILEKLHWNLPYFIQIMFAKIKDGHTGGVISEEDIDSAYRGLYSEDYLSTWSERLAEYSQLETAARKVLKGLALHQDGMNRHQMLDMLMIGVEHEMIDEIEYQMSLTLNMLENDGYIMRKENGARVFRSPVLRDYWQYKFID